MEEESPIIPAEATDQANSIRCGFLHGDSGRHLQVWQTDERHAARLRAIRGLTETANGTGLGLDAGIIDGHGRNARDVR